MRYVLALAVTIACPWARGHIRVGVAGGAARPAAQGKGTGRLHPTRTQEDGAMRRYRVEIRTYPEDDVLVWAELADGDGLSSKGR
jgi:hypothetical protein